MVVIYCSNTDGKVTEFSRVLLYLITIQICAMQMHCSGFSRQANERFRHLFPEANLASRWTRGGWVSHRAGMDMSLKRKIWFQPEIDHQSFHCRTLPRS